MLYTSRLAISRKPTNKMNNHIKSRKKNKPIILSVKMLGHVGHEPLQIYN